MFLIDILMLIFSWFSIIFLIIIIELGFCNYESTVEGSRGMFHWNESIVNATAHTNCFYGPAEVMATRHCISRDIWGVVFVDLCRTVISEQLSAFQQVIL